MNARTGSEREKTTTDKSALDFGNIISIPYANRDQARQGDPEKSDFYLSLAGNWQVSHNWYTNTSYQRNFLLPANWEGKQVFAQFTDTKAAIRLWLNNQEVNHKANQDNSLAFNLTAFLQAGENQLNIQIPAKNFPFVFLWAVTNVHIQDFRFITTPANKNQSTGWKITIEADMINLDTQPAINHRIETMLFDHRGIPVWIGPLGVMVSIDPGNVNSSAFSYHVKKARPWSPQDPYLYTLILEMRDADGTLLDLRSAKVSFR